MRFRSGNGCIQVVGLLGVVHSWMIQMNVDIATQDAVKNMKGQGPG